MSSYFWHIKFAKAMVELAEDELHKNNYVSINSLLKAFEEIVDANCALFNIHYHEDPSTGWKNRIEWIKDKRLDYEWEKIINLINQFYTNKCEKNLEEIIFIIKNNIRILERSHNKNK